MFEAARFAHEAQGKLDHLSTRSSGLRPKRICLLSRQGVLNDLLDLVGVDDVEAEGRLQLFHPGVWLKNFALGTLARRLNAVAVNLLIDTDTIKKEIRSGDMRKIYEDLFEPDR